MNALDVIVDGDLGEVPLRYYLGKLLYRLWIDGEGFSGKRPFGNSGWDHDVARALCKAGVVKGVKWRWYSWVADDTKDGELIEGDFEHGEYEFDWKEVTKVVQKSINEAFNIQVEEEFK